MADLSRKTASIYINHAPAEEALKKLQADADKLTASIKKGQDAGKSMVGELTKLNKTKTDIASLQRQIDNGLKPSFNQLATMVAKTRAELKKMSESDAGFIQKTKELNKYSTELARLGKQIGAVKQESGGIGSLLGNMVPAIGLASAGAAVVGFLKGAVTEALEADKALGKFKGTLDNLGKTEAFDRLAGKAEDMAKRVKFLDSPDIIGVFDKLITYGKLTEAQIDKLTPVIIDFSVKSKISLDESASVIIKALEGNGKALKEYGINIKDAKTESERLGVIMDELGPKVRGAADAFGETTAGKIAITEQSIKDLKEEIGTGLLPIMNKSLSIFARFINGINGIATSVKSFGTDGFFKGVARSGESFISYLTLGLVKLNDIDAKLEAAKKKAALPNEIAEGIATEVGQKTVAEQKVLANAYKNVFINARKELAAFMNSADKDDKVRGDKLRAQVEQKGKIFLSTQRALNDSISTAAKNAVDETDKKVKKSTKNNDAAIRKAMADAEKLQKIWEDLTNRINDPFALMADDPVAQAFKKVKDQAQKDTDAAKMLLDKKVIDYKEYSDSIVRIEQIRIKALQDIAEKYKLKNTKDAYMPGRATTAGPLATGGIKANNQQFEKDQAKLFRDGLAKQELASITSYGKKKLQADLNVLELQKAQELANKDLTENEKFLIEETYRQKRSEAEMNHNVEIAQFALDSAQQLLQIFQAFSAGSEAADEEKFKQNQRRYDEDKNKLDRQLRQKIVSQKEYDRQIKAIDDKKRKEDAAVKKKEFERNKQAQIIQAIMSGAQAIVSTLAARPGFTDIVSLGAFRAINIGLAIAATTAQVAKLASQKAPQYGSGGLLDGPTHSNGGMPVINPATGKKVMEVEGGEPILSRRTYSNNKYLVDQLLHASMYGGGARISHYPGSENYRRLNYSGVTQSMDMVRHYANGGIMTGSNSTVNNNNSNPVIIDNSDIIAAIKEMNTNLRAYVLLSDINAQQDTMDLIRKETTITR